MAEFQSCAGCGKEGVFNLKCPSCFKYESPDNALFCSADCFKDNWIQHKEVHIKLQGDLMNEVKAIEREASSGSGGRRARASIRLLELMAVLSTKEQSFTWGTSTLANFKETCVDDVWRKDPHLARFIGYKFTGTLRPYPYERSRKVPKSVPFPDYGLHILGVANSEMRAQRLGSKIETCDEETISRLREAGIIGRAALDLSGRLIKPGVTTEEIDKQVHEFIVSKGAYPSPLNYFNFPKSLCTSVNEVICHGIPDMRKLNEGDICNVDITVFYKGVHADLNETFFVGTPSPEAERLVRGAYECLMKAVKEVKPGMYYREIGNIIQDRADSLHLSVTKSYCGHGIHHLFHCEPNVPHYRNNKAVGRIAVGHCFTIEPMLNLGTWKDQLWPDDWTAVTKDGQWSAQFEHTLLVTETGVEILTARNSDSPSLGFDTDPFD
eukprot:GHVH01000791.1.p1 GENE.GHVH01000791.1~~GHVH01000791.1.p1  ORF type:complete len:438 (-),score=57.44 GHVH01000791.1:27-1340(-)